jgi:hypothetical protein
MYYNVFGEKVSRARYREMLTAAKNRRELIAAGLTSRRDLFKMGLLTAGGMLVAKAGLSARAVYGQTVNGGTNQLCLPNMQPASPPTRAFIEPLPIMARATRVRSLTPTPTLAPNTAAGEVRAAPFCDATASQRAGEAVLPLPRLGREIPDSLPQRGARRPCHDGALAHRADRRHRADALMLNRNGALRHPPEGAPTTCSARRHQQ